MGGVGFRVWGKDFRILGVRLRVNSLGLGV